MQKTALLTLISFTPVLLTQSLVHAQTDAGVSEEIVITANRTARPLSTIPNTVTIIDSSELAQQITVNNDLSTILGNLIPSFSPSRQKLSGAGESLRGRSPMYMLDGVPQSNPLRDGSRDGHTIDPLMLERVEVIHGANAIHGLGAAGGIINLITRHPGVENQQSLRVESVFQDAEPGDSLGYGATYSFSGMLNEQIDFLASLSYRESGVGFDGNGRVIGFDNTQGDTMDSSTLNGFVKTGYDWDDQRLEFTVNHYEIEGNNNWLSVNGDVSSGTPTTAIEARVPGAAPENEVTLFSVNYNNESFFGHSLHIHGFSQEFTAVYGGGVFAAFQDPVYGADLFDQSANNSTKQGFKLTLVNDRPANLPVNLVYGIDFFNDETFQELVQSGRKWVPATKYKNYAPFVQADVDLMEELVLSAGIRHEESILDVGSFTTLASYNGGQYVVGGEPEFSETLYNIGATYSLSDYWRLFGNFSESFSMPDVGRVLRGIDQPGLSIENVLDLKPILTENAEAGLEFTRSDFNAQISFYTSESDFGQRLQANADGIFSVMREQTEVNGIELRGEWAASTDDLVGLRYALTEGEFDSNGDGRVDTDLDGSNISPDRLNLSWNRIWSNNLSSRVQLNHLIDRDFTDSSGLTSSQFEGYTTADVSADIILGDGKLSLSVQNLFDTEFLTYYAQTVGGDTRYFTGFGRSFGVNYELRF